MRWRESRNLELFDELKNELDIIKLRGIMSEAVFFIVQLWYTQSNISLHEQLIKHPEDFQDTFKHFSLDSLDRQLPAYNDPFDYMEELVKYKSVTRPIRLNNHKFGLGMAIVPLYYHPFLNFISKINPEVDEDKVNYNVHIEKLRLDFHRFILTNDKWYNNLLRFYQNERLMFLDLVNSSWEIPHHSSCVECLPYDFERCGIVYNHKILKQEDAN
jgi:hypothetical protein